MGTPEEHLEALEGNIEAMHAEITKLVTFEASVSKTQAEVAKLATFEANVKAVAAAQEEKMAKQCHDASKLVEACRHRRVSFDSH